MRTERGRLLACILAAGRGRRLHGRHKALLRPRGATLLAGQLAVLRRLGVAAVVIEGAHRSGRRTPTRYNPAWRSGLASSVACCARLALRHPRRPAGLLLLPGDLPLETPAQRRHLAALLARWRTVPRRALATCHAGRPGAPAILPPTEWTALLRLRGDRGAAVLLAGADCLPAPDDLRDVDRIEDLWRLRWP